MANKFQFHFTIEGGKRVLPVTTDNVTVVFKTRAFIQLVSFLDIPDEHISDPSSAAAWWIIHGEDTRWRHMIYALDTIGETELAYELMPYSEPPSDPSLTAVGVIPIFMELQEWWSTGVFYCGGYHLVPESRADIIRTQYTSLDDQKREAAIYYVMCYPDASWGHLAKCLYRSGERRAIETFKAQLPELKDPTLTVETLLLATDGVDMPKSPACLESYLDMPDDTYHNTVRKCSTEDELRRKLFSEFLTYHPYPRWEVVIELLETLERQGKARARLAQEVKEKYLTSVRALFTLCVGHIVNNYKLYEPLLPRLLPHHIHTHITSLPAWQQQLQLEEVEPPMPKRRKVCISDDDEVEALSAWQQQEADMFPTLHH